MEEVKLQLGLEVDERVFADISAADHPKEVRSAQPWRSTVGRGCAKRIAHN
jgi:hypothetical protein